MTLRTLATASAALLLATASSGCLDDNFDPPSLVKTWRILAIVADPPEAAPGVDLALSALVVDPTGHQIEDPEAEGLVYRYTACIRPEQVAGLSGVQYDPASPSPACGDLDDPQVLSLPTESGRATIPGLLTRDAFTQLEQLGAIFGDRLPDGVLMQIAEQTGLPVTVELAVFNAADDQRIVTAFKRVLLSRRPDPGTNPPPPRLRVDGRWVAPSDRADGSCEAEDGGALTTRRRETVALSPDEDDMRWVESYNVLDIQGQLQRVEERPYYSFFGTGGSFEREVTRAPVRDEVWTAPRQAGTANIWVVVRDGHGGTSHCRFTVDVE